MQGVLPSEVAQIPAQIGNLEVHQPQGRHDAESEGRELPLFIQCDAMKVFDLRRATSNLSDTKRKGSQ